MFYTLVYMVFVVDGRILSLIFIMEISYILHIRKPVICYRWSRSIDSRKVRNESRCFVISCCLLAGQCPTFMAFFFVFCRCGSSRVHWRRRWSIVWSPCSQGHVAFSRILNLWRYARVFPCPIIITAIFCVTLILVFNLS